jgi:tetratricopeptide (TPR) repeat protein
MDERRAKALWTLGGALYRLRRFSDAIRPLEDAEHAATLVPGCENVWADSRCLRAGALLGLERWAEVVELTDDLVEVEDWPYKAKYLQTGLHVRVVALKALDRWQDAAVAASALRESLPAEETPRTRQHLREALEIQAWVAHEARDPQSGLPSIDQAIAIAEQDQDREPLSRALIQRAELLYAAGRNAEAREALRTVIDTFRGAPEDYAISAVAIARGLKLRMRFRLRSPRAAL